MIRFILILIIGLLNVSNVWGIKKNTYVKRNPQTVQKTKVVTDTVRVVMSADEYIKSMGPLTDEDFIQQEIRKDSIERKAFINSQGVEKMPLHSEETIIDEIEDITEDNPETVNLNNDLEGKEEDNPIVQEEGAVEEVYVESDQSIVSETTVPGVVVPELSTSEKISAWCSNNNVFDRLTGKFSFGTTGFGLEFSTPLTQWVDLRLGVDWIPKVNVPMEFNINTFSEGEPSDNFVHVKDLLYEMTGMEVDEEVNMLGKPRMLNFKLLFNVYPFKEDRRWYFTAGFYLGNRIVATAINSKTEMPDLVGLNIYNRAYHYFTTLQDIYDVPIGGGAYMKPETVERLRSKFLEYGTMGIHVGDFKNGEPYILQPSPDGSVSAKAYVNRFKPYLGAGFATPIDKYGRWKFGVEAGMLIWGGAPNVYHYDYNLERNINFTKDLVNIGGKVGDYIRLIKALPVYPVVNVSISYDIL